MKFNNSVTLAMTISETILNNGKVETAQIMSFEVNPIKEEEQGMQQCAEEEAEGFGVYARMQNGLASWLADFDTKASANDFFHLLQSVYRLGKTSASHLPDPAQAKEL